MKKILIMFCLFTTAASVDGWAEAAVENGQQATGVVVEVKDNVIQPNGVFNVLTYEAPEEIALKNTGLKEAGLALGLFFLKSDEIRIFGSRDAMQSSPLARIWLNEKEGGSYWFQTGGEGSAENYVIPKGAVVIVWTRASTAPVSWNNVFK